MKLTDDWHITWGPARPRADRIVLAGAILGGFIVGFGSQAWFHNWLANSLIAVLGGVGMAALLQCGKE